MEEAIERKPRFSLQWHLTTACPNRCRHCYMERSNQTLPLRICQRIVDDFKSLLKRWDCDGRIHFTGGDPLLYPGFFELLHHVRTQIPSLRIGILGNPELLTKEIAERLEEEEVFSYQMSLDGLERTHDYLRHPGSFKVTLEKIPLLRGHGIRVDVMSTVSKLNLEEIPELVDIVVENEVDFFGFKRLVPIENGANMMESAMIPPQEFRRFLFQMDKKYQERQGDGTVFGGGEPLWKLFYFEKKKPPREEIKTDKLIGGGCSIGCSGLSILEDGTVLACRRLPISIGKLPSQKIRDIFILSSILNKMREIEKIEKCRDCPVLLYCKGCRAIAYAVKNDYFAPDPQCWRET